MTLKGKILFFVLFLSATLGISSSFFVEETGKVQDNQNSSIHSGGFYMDCIEIEYYSKSADSKPEEIVLIKDKSIILKLITLMNRLPENGEIFMKLPSTSSCYKVIFINEDEIVKTVKIYNDRFQCENTAFLGEDFKEDETIFVDYVKEISKK